MSSFQLSRRPRLVLIGNYGVGNSGDEALREYFLSHFPEVEWTVLTGRAEEQEGKRATVVPRLPLGIRSLFTRWWRTIAAIHGSDAVVFGGGSLFTDAESIVACILWWWHGVIAWACGKPMILAFQGVGPFRSWLAEKLARRTFERAAFISVRDEESLARISPWHLQAPPILSFDPVFKIFSARKRATSERRVLVIIPRGNSTAQFFVTVSEKLTSGFDEIRILLLQHDAEERSVAQWINALARKRAATREIASIDQLLDEVSISSEVVAQRYHGALAAIAIGVPVTIVPQEEGDKMDGLRLVQRDPASQSRLLKRVEAGEAALRCALCP